MLYAWIIGHPCRFGVSFKTIRIVDWLMDSGKLMAPMIFVDPPATSMVVFASLWYLRHSWLIVVVFRTLVFAPESSRRVILLGGIVGMVSASGPSMDGVVGMDTSMRNHQSSKYLWYSGITTIFVIILKGSDRIKRSYVTLYKTGYT